MVRARIGKTLLLGALAVLTLGLASRPAQAAGDTLLIRGTLTYLPRIALAPDSMAIVELRDSASADAPVVAEQRMALQGRQVPVAFALGVDRATLLPGVRYAVRGAIFAAGRPAWATEPLVVDTTAEVLELGELVMAPVRAQGFASSFRCGDRTITVGFLDNLLRLQAGAEAIDLQPVESASGALFSAGTEPPTTFWSKGDRATLVLHGVTYPECVVVQRAPAPAFRARGNEPGWSLVIDEAGLALTTRYGETRLVATGHTVETSGGVRRYRADADGRALAVTVEDRPCTDTMSGLPHPNTVTVMVDNERLEGCGGDPSALLQGGEWLVQAIDGQPLVADSRPTLAFADGRVAGSASCNRYTGGFTLTGEGLTVGQVATTMMACPPALMAQERLFLDVLAAVRGFALDPDGTLVLRTHDQRTITARRLEAGLRHGTAGFLDHLSRVVCLTGVRLHRTVKDMRIRSVRHKGLKRLLEDDDSRGIRRDLANRVRNIVAALVAAQDMNGVEGPPGWRIHQLTGDRAGTWSISASGNWRITFELEHGEISNLDLEDYH